MGVHRDALDLWLNPVTGNSIASAAFDFVGVLVGGRQRSSNSHSAVRG